MNKILKSVIVDDEKLAREDLKSVLKEFSNVEVVGEADSAESAAALLKTIEPDILFLDIQMPGKTGFDLLAEVQTSAKIIFVTAYDEYAIKAFEVSAQDYLLKPVSKSRIELALEHLEISEESKSAHLNQLDYNDTIFVMINNSYQFLKINTIIKIIAAGNYSEVYTNGKQKGLVLKSLREWENRLPGNQFVRVHRNSVINLEYVEKIEDWFNYSYKIHLKGIEGTVIMSRRYALKLKDKLA
ncbi:MAG: LytTR family DNA-binding domain-containing protein [Ignavibacteria bacterium]|nr:LytTR family DNA-binding domain-containing protein [Ignavibacteria bacterium]